jgi:hypothetical protein
MTQPETSVRQNHRLVLARRPDPGVGPLADDVLRYEAGDMPQITNGQFLVRNHWMSLDPATRTRMAMGLGYTAPTEIGDVISALCAGQVVASKHSAFPVDTLVEGMFGGQEFGASDGKGARVIPSTIPLAASLNVFGINGFTAWFGIHDIGKPKAGETAVVTSAAGGVGSVAVQLLVAAGCRVIGIAGSADKSDWVRSLGAADCINYKADDLEAALSKLCPDRIDIIYDNVGGSMLDALLPHIALNSRLILCGAISRYKAEPDSLKNWFQLLINRARMQGFIYRDHLDRVGEAEADMLPRLQKGEIKYRDHIIEGLQNAPQALGMLFDGTNRGKIIVRVTSDAR